MSDFETTTKTKSKRGVTAYKSIREVKPPSDFAVVFYNDNFTPMEFVTFVLIEIFRHSMDRAHQIMLNVHEKGSSIAGTFRYEIAEAKATETIILAKEHQYPLKVTVEEL